MSGETRLTRRTFLRAVGAGATWFATAPLVGCAPYASAGRGLGFAPWDLRGDEGRPELRAVRAALLAASPHNTQPWLFRVTDGTIDVFADGTRFLGAMDSLRREMYLGLGCAIENAALTARAAGRSVAVSYLPGGDEGHAARLTLAPAPVELSPLAAAIPERRMNKFGYTEAPVDPAVLAALPALVDDPRVVLRVVTDAAERARLRQLSIDAVVAITRDAEMAQASHRWWRQTAEEVAAHRDGLNLDIMGLPTVTRAFAGTLKSVAVDKANAYWIDATKTRHTTGAGYFLLSTAERESREQQLRCGRVFQRIHLYLTTRGVDVHTINMLPEMQDREQTTAAGERRFSAAGQALVPAGHGLQMLARFGHAGSRAYHTPRRALEEVLAKAP